MIKAKHKFLSDNDFGQKGTYSIVLPIDQGVEHGPFAAFLNTEHPEMLDVEYQTDYINELLNEGLVSATALPARTASVLLKKYPEQAGNIITKYNHSNNLNKDLEPNQWQHTRRLWRKVGALGWTIYPGSTNQAEQTAGFLFEKAVIPEKKTVLWSYPRGGDFDDTSLETIMHAAYIAAQLEPDVIKVKLPTSNYEKAQVDNVRNIVKAACGIPVLFSGGSKKDEESVLNDAKAIAKGGGLGMIIGRNVFQRPPKDAKNLLNKIHKIFGDVK